MHDLSSQQRLIVQLQKLGFLLNKAADTSLQSQVHFGLSQFRILIMLKQDSNCSQIHIADMLDQTEAAVSRQINLMVQEGLVARITKPSNRRERILSLTDKGQELLDRGWAALDEVQREVFEGVDDKDQQALNDHVQHMVWRLHRYLQLPDQPKH